MTAVLLLLLVVLPACGTSRTRALERTELLLSTTPPRDPGCGPESDPQALPGVDAVVDSAMIAAAVADLLHGDPAPDGHVLLSLGFDRNGLNMRREVIEHAVDPVVADSVQQIVFAARREVSASEREWGVRLRIDVGRSLTLRTGRREFCPPVARDRTMEAMMAGFNPAGVRYRGGRRERVVHMRALVDPTGTVVSARMVRGGLSGSSLERDLARYLQQFLFEPATVDGRPVPAWVEIPVRIPA